MDLSDILDEIKSDVDYKRTIPDQHDYSTRSPHWSEADKVDSVVLKLSPYELYWLEWRLIVHLRSYSAVEWSEMKEALQQILDKISTLSSKEEKPNALP